jgi:hypothetical protein
MELSEQLLVELKRFLNEEGKLTIFPSKKQNKMLVLLYLSAKFQPEVIYTEKEVNEIIDQYHTFQDKWLLRRELINQGFLSRLPDGSQYWMTKEQPEVFH